MHDRQGWATLAGTRASTRRFAQQEVPQDWIGQMLQEARCAPSGAN
ncbi:nitroreductase family protein, partial [Pseudorhodoferax soli]